jgi:glutamine amidotransferase
MEKQVCIIDYGSGNVRSVYNIFMKLHDNVKVSNKAEDIEQATHLILPGVGAFGAAMQKIKALPTFDCLQSTVVKEGKWFLGICLGMQILADCGEEHGDYQGLGWIPGAVRRLQTCDLHLPHVGWNNFTRCADNSLLNGIAPETDFYYVHSFYFETKDKEHDIADCEYGQEFCCAVNKDNIYGVQFHPEKSQKAGMKLLKNFLNLS